MSKDTTSEIKRLDNGNVEILFTIPGILLNEVKKQAINELAINTVVAGFRKGKAPLAKVEEVTSDEKLTDHILKLILPKAFADSVSVHKFKPAIYPKFDAVKITSSKNISIDGEWQLKAITCEMPKIKLGDYKKKLKFDKKDQNVLIKSLIDAINPEIPKMLIDEEVNARLSQVLERIEKLGLALEGYLKSVGKTPEELRAEYEIQAKNSIALEIILNEVSNEEKIEVTEKEIDEFIKTTGTEIKVVDKNQRDVIKRVILRRSALDKLSK